MSSSGRGYGEGSPGWREQSQSGGTSWRSLLGAGGEGGRRGKEGACCFSSWACSFYHRSPGCQLVSSRAQGSELEEAWRWWLEGGGPLWRSLDRCFLSPQGSHVPLHRHLEGNTLRFPQEDKGVVTKHEAVQEEGLWGSADPRRRPSVTLGAPPVHFCS